MDCLLRAQRGLRDGMASDVRALAEKLGPVDVAIVGCDVRAIADTHTKYTGPIVVLFKPNCYCPRITTRPPRPGPIWLEPLFDRLHAEMLGTAPRRSARAPICVAAADPDKDKVVPLKY